METGRPRAEVQAALVVLRHLQHGLGYTEAERRTLVAHVMRQIFFFLPWLPEEERQDVRAVLYHYRLLPERRRSGDRRTTVEARAPDARERRCLPGRRQARDLSRWL